MSHTSLKGKQKILIVKDFNLFINDFIWYYYLSQYGRVSEMTSFIQKIKVCNKNQQKNEVLQSESLGVVEGCSHVKN